MTTSLDGKVAIVTGGASGIGRAVVQALAARGAFPIIFDVDADGARKVVDELAAASRKALAVTVDVRDRLAVANAVNAVAAERGRLDYMFNNAGITQFAEVQDYDWPAWRDIIETDFMGVVHGVAACYPIMVRQGSGHIVNTASLAGLMPTPWGVSYTAAKSAVWGLSLSLRIEAAPLGVKVTVVCPAAVWTPIIERARYINLDRERAVAAIPGSRITAEACAAAILKGVERNKAVITPSAARWLALVQRISPWLVERIMGRVSGKLRAIRAEHLRLNAPAPEAAAPRKPEPS